MRHLARQWPSNRATHSPIDVVRSRRNGLLFALVFLPCRLPAQSSATPTPSSITGGRLLGVFDIDGGAPIEGAEVFDARSGLTATTSATGTVTLTFLANGESILRVRKIGYAAQFIAVFASPKDTASVTVALRRITDLPAVRITERSSAALGQLSGFQRRRAEGNGHFIDEAELREADGSLLADVLARIPGVIIERSARSSYLRSARSADLKSACYPDVFLNEVLLSPAGRKAVDLSDLLVSDLGGIEFYPGGASAPAEFNRTGSGCGILLLWSRVR